MYQEDFILRMIRMATIALQRILGFKQAGEYTQAQEVIDSMLEQVLGLRADLVRRLDDESLLQSLVRQGSLDVDRLLIVADMFAAEAGLQQAQGDQQSARLTARRALILYLEATLERGAAPGDDVEPKIQALLELVGIDLLPANSLYALFVYSESVRRYRQAEHALERLAQVEVGGLDVREERTSFYQRLLALPEEALTKAGFTSDQLQAKLAAIRSG